MQYPKLKMYKTMQIYTLVLVIITNKNSTQLHKRAKKP